MTLDEAIEHAEKTAEEYDRQKTTCEVVGHIAMCEKYAERNRQLAEWLKELKARRITGKSTETIYIDCPWK